MGTKVPPRNKEVFKEAEKYELTQHIEQMGQERNRDIVERSANLFYSWLMVQKTTAASGVRCLASFPHKFPGSFLNMESKRSPVESLK